MQQNDIVAHNPMKIGPLNFSTQELDIALRVINSYKKAIDD